MRDDKVSYLCCVLAWVGGWIMVGHTIHQCILHSSHSCSLYFCFSMVHPCVDRLKVNYQVSMLCHGQVITWPFMSQWYQSLVHTGCRSAAIVLIIDSDDNNAATASAASVSDSSSKQLASLLTAASCKAPQLQLTIPLLWITLMAFC